VTAATGSAPFILHKWVGGKRQLYPEIRRRLPAAWSGRYIEPFFGSGVVYYNLGLENPALIHHAFLADANPCVRTLIECLGSGHGCAQVGNLISERIEASADPANREALYAYAKQYAHARQTVNADGSVSDHVLRSEHRTAAFLYLIHTNHGGLWRTNKAGLYNVPIGRVAVNGEKVPVPFRYDVPRLDVAHRILSQSNPYIYARAFDAIACADEGDVIYADPPYVPQSPTASFTAYDPRGFGAAHQRDLAQLLQVASDRGAHVVTSNSDTPMVRALYAGWNMDVVSRSGTINSDSTKRGRVNELLIWKDSRMTANTNTAVVCPTTPCT
jgi:DNA adenine methylase